MLQWTFKRTTTRSGRSPGRLHTQDEGALLPWYAVAAMPLNSKDLSGDDIAALQQRARDRPVALYRSLYRKPPNRARNHRIHTIHQTLFVPACLCRVQCIQLYSDTANTVTTLYTLPPPTGRAAGRGSRWRGRDGARSGSQKVQEKDVLFGK